MEGILHSLLYIPALSADFLAKAHTRGADAIIVDLEDAIAPARKAQARAALDEGLRVLAGHGLAAWVRVNNDPALLAADLEAAVRSDVRAILLPKVEGPRDVALADAAIAELERRQRLAAGTIELCALVETPLGILRLDAICGAGGRLAAVAFGGEDLALGLGVTPAYETLRTPAQLTVIAARAHGLPVYGLPGSVAEYVDMEAYGELCTRARALGFDGAMCIHPRQVEAVNARFRATAGEIEFARRVVAAYEAARASGQGAVALDGRMVDLPVVERARRTLARVDATASPPPRP